MIIPSKDDGYQFVLFFDLVEVMINTHTTNSFSTGVLLDCRLGPATEGRPAAPGSRAIPIAPPKTKALPGVPVAHKSIPLMLVGVNTTELAAEDLLGGIGKVVHESAVLGIAAEPVLSAFDIEPHLTVLDVLCVVPESLNLALGVAALRAREHVDIHMLHTTRPGVGNALSAVLVGVTSAAIATNDCKLVTVILEALPGTHTIELRNMNTNGSITHSKACCKSNKSKRETHIKQLKKARRHQLS